MSQPSQRATRDLSGIGTLVAVFYVLDRLVERLCTLPEAAYYGTTIMAGFARHILDSGIASAGLLFVVIVLVLDAARKRSMLRRWTDFEHGTHLRLLTITIAGLLAWSFSSYSTNLYFDQGHVWDRALLVLLVPVVYWRPIGLFPFVCVVLAVANQFGYPAGVGRWGWTEPSLLVRIQMLVLAFVAVRSIQEYLPAASRWGSHKVSSNSLVLTIMCLIGAFYFAAGVGKIRLNWIAINHVAYLLPATYSAGWLSFVEPAAIERLTAILMALNTPIKLVTIALEVGALFVLLSRRVTRLFLFGWICFHLGIFVTSGIFFWRWIILDAILLIAFFGRRGPGFDLYRPSLRIAAVILVLLGNIWARPTTLAWLDAPVNYAYRVTAVTSGGTHARLPPRFFEPYDYQFTLANFGSTVPDTLLGITFGAARSEAVIAALDGADSPEAALAVERNMGASRYNAGRRHRMETFLGQFATAWNRRRADNPSFGERHAWKTIVSAPTHVWTFPRRARIPRGATIDSVFVDQVLSHYDGVTYREIRARRVMSIAVD